MIWQVPGYPPLKLSNFIIGWEWKIIVVVAFGSITLKQSQVAVGFVLTMLCADLSSVLGNSLVRIAGPTVPNWPLPGLHHLPWLGPILFQSNLLVYLSYLMILGSWLHVYYTPWG